MKVGEQIKTTITLHVCNACGEYIAETLCSATCKYDCRRLNDRPVMKRTFQRVDTLESEEFFQLEKEKTSEDIHKVIEAEVAVAPKDVS